MLTAGNFHFHFNFYAAYVCPNKYWNHLSFFLLNYFIGFLVISIRLGVCLQEKGLVKPFFLSKRRGLIVLCFRGGQGLILWFLYESMILITYMSLFVIISVVRKAEV